MKQIAAWFGVFLMVLTGYFAFWPIPIAPNAWVAQSAPGYVGPHAQNTKLAGLSSIDIGKEVGPEHIAFGPDGKLYAAVASGNILRMDARGLNQEVFVNTGGRTLGFDFDPSGRLIAADALRGLLAVTKDKVEVLTDKVDGQPIRATITFMNRNGAGDLDLRLLTGDGGMVLDDSKTSADTEMVLCPGGSPCPPITNGTYLIEVKGFTASVTSAYVLHIETTADVDAGVDAM